MGYINVLKGVIFKNLIMRKYHWVATTFQVILPVILFATAAIIATKADGFENKYVNHSSFGSQHSSGELYDDTFNHETKIYYTPSTYFTSELMYEVQLKFSLNSESIKNFDSEDKMMSNIDYDADSVLAVKFKNITTGETPKKLVYSIRPYEKYVDWQTETLYSSSDSYIPDSGSETYFNKGFLAFQMALESSYIEMVSNKSLPVSLTVQEFPYPPHIENSESKNMIKYFLPVITVLSFAFLCPIIITRIMEDKVSGMKELMRIMGLKSHMIWFTWFWDMFCWNFISIDLITTILLYLNIDMDSALLAHCSFSVVLAFFSLYLSAVITFCFALSSFFNKPMHAMSTTMLIWMITFAVSQKYIDEYLFGIEKIILIFPNACLLFGYNIIAEYETREIGVQWSNIFQSSSWESDEFTMGNIFIYFIMQIIVYVIITLYLNEIRPGIYGKPRPLYFPLQWFRRHEKEQKRNLTRTNFDDYIEKVDLPVSVHVRNVSKLFNNHKAVDDLSIDFYEHQITVLLGKNGAGKTTTLSIIAGMLNPTTGNILINNTLNMKNFVSICPQNNLQFPALSVLQHLRFYGILKGLSFAQSLKEAETIIGLISLSNKRNSLPSQLSGGMQRRLSVAIAIIGSDNVVILDEPTTGLDPESRREIWDILISLRGYRTFIVTTHSMEEAEILGDRIAILDGGLLKSYGTPIFLRNKLGAGSYLSLDLKSSSDKERLMRDINNNSNLKCHLKPSTNEEIRLFLENTSNCEIKDALKWFETSKHVENTRLTKTTMEEIFLRASTLGFEYTRPPSETNQQEFKKSNEIKAWRQFQVLFAKWVTFTRWKLQVIQIITLILCVLISLGGSGSSLSVLKHDSGLSLNLQKYGKSAVFIQQNEESIFPTIANYYQDLVNSSARYSERVKDVVNAIIQQGIRNIEFYKKHMIAAVAFDSINGTDVATALYSNKAVHGAPISLNLLSNAVIKTVVGDDYAIIGENYPLPSPSEHRIEHLSMIEVLLIWYIFLPLGSLLLVGISLFCPNSEYISKIMHLQQMCGVSKWLYWLSCYVKDLLVYIVSIAIVIGITYICNSYLHISSIFGKDEIGALFVILLSFGVSAIPYSYMFCYKSSAFVGYGLYISTSLLISNTIVVGIFYLEYSDDDELKSIAATLNYVFVLFPTYGLKYTVMQLIRQSVWNHNWNLKSPEHKQTVCATNYNPCCSGNNTTECIRYQSHFNGQDSITNNVVEIILSSLLYFFILYVLETTSLSRGYFKLKKRLRANVGTDTSQRDEVKKRMKVNVRNGTSEVEKKDLLAEHSACLNADIKSKTFGSQEVLTGIKFKIDHKERVGLLGVNGAGKSVTFRLLAGEEPLEDGDITLKKTIDEKFSIRENKLRYSQNLGYCPQFDDLSNLASGRVLLRLFATLRGVEEIEEEVNKFLTLFSLEEHADQLCNTYSIGCKRKLFTAFALIGMPPYIMLDEPTAGVDLDSRRKLWDALIHMKNMESSIILSTHNMDECEVLCNRIVTLKSGKIIYRGSMNDFKNKYKEFCTISLKLKPTITVCTQETAQAPNKRETTNLNEKVDSIEISNLKNAIELKFAEHELLDQHATLIKYRVKGNERRLSEIFETIELIHNDHPIVEDFDISEMTLETLFLNVNKENVITK